MTMRNDKADLEALANRIDHEELWRRSPFDRDTWTQEQRDRCDAAVNLRRYAHDRGVVAEQLKVGAEYIRGSKLERAGMGTDARGCGTNGWHRAINALSNKMQDEWQSARNEGESFTTSNPNWPRMMYLAKTISDEVPRAILLFDREREGKLAGAYKMCAHDPAPPIDLPDNHLRCHLDVRCSDCQWLRAIDTEPIMTPEAKDEAKAWTCATHVLLETDPHEFFHLEELIYDKSTAAFEATLARNMTNDE